MKKLFCLLLVCLLFTAGACAELAFPLPEGAETVEEMYEAGEGYAMYALDGGLTFAEVYMLAPTVYGMIGEGTAHDFADLFGDAVGCEVTETVLDPIDSCQAVQLTYTRGSNEDTTDVTMVALWAEEATYVVFFNASADFGDPELITTMIEGITIQ